MSAEQTERKMADANILFTAKSTRGSCFCCILIFIRRFSYFPSCFPFWSIAKLLCCSVFVIFLDPRCLCCLLRSSVFLLTSSQSISSFSLRMDSIFVHLYLILSRESCSLCPFSIQFILFPRSPCHFLSSFSTEVFVLRS